MTQFLSSRNRNRYFVRGVVEIVDAMRFWRLWSLMGVSALRSRYSRSRVGEFWLTLSMGIMVFALGLIWSLIWRLPLADIVPYIAVSLVVWTFMTGTITDATRSLIMASSYLINQRMYATIPVYSVIYKVEADELTICLESANKNRPKQFTGKSGSGCVLEVWRRVKP